ncbi:hypothetical protein [Rossellomorea aquimaris]|uniref:Voltage-dependent anion channel n=1 Tax=Rossellomorea aquimaris TaxID=189382 RepID=A0A1J6WW45_9BACI|nr:hypothetical protein [Rossellomorea aquimaris]OIU72055.1 hypothetical protein BHE18_05310 [Rossellomorea aquimaris]
MSEAYFILLLTGCLTYYFYKKRIYIQTSSLAIVMALGIFTQGVFHYYLGMDYFTGFTGKLLSGIVLSLWMSFILSIAASIKNRKFRELHLLNPINRFGIGTWIASSSLCGIIIYEQFSQMAVPVVILIVNFTVWVFYIGVIIPFFIKQNNQEVNGIILLSTVSTQSLVLLSHAVYQGSNKILFFCLIAGGIIFYIICLLFILKRYLFTNWSVVHDWKNTNCILHGALSITGVASVSTASMPLLMMKLLWVAATLMFIFVESLEIARMVKRLRILGFREGIWTYHVSQWSRIFTFAMYFTFTLLFEPKGIILEAARNLAAAAGIWVVISVTFLQTAIWFTSFWYVARSYQHKEKSRIA